MILGIETASSVLSVAIVDHGRILTSLLVNRGNAHDELLAPLIEQGFRLAAITGGDLTAVAVSEGPGSFTGLRIGMAAAKGLALSLSLPLIAVPTFDAIAARVAAGLSPGTPEDLAVVFDARRDDVYIGIYQLQHGRAELETQVSALSLADAGKLLPPGILLAGDGASVMQEAFQGVALPLNTLR